MARDLYSVLGLSKGATATEIKKAYRKLARDLHPDRHKGDKTKEERFKDVTQAYQVLSDEKRRKLYDEFGDAGLREGFDPDMARQYASWQGGRTSSAPPGGFSFDFNVEDIFGGRFDDFFRRGSEPGPGPSRKRRRQRSTRPPAHGGDFESEVTLDLGDALRGAEREFTFQMPAGNRTLRVRIPPGVTEGARVRLKGQGSQPEGGEAGDLILKIKIRPHPHYWREDGDLHLKLPVTPLEAFQGATVSVPTLDGSVSLRVPPRTQGGTKLRLRGKGVKAKDGESVGDLIVHVNIVLPEGDEKTTAKILEQLEKKFETQPRQSVRL